MKIGIVTLPLSLNYGGYLQNFAMHTILKRMGHEVWTIDHGKYTWMDWLNINSRILVHKLLGHRQLFFLTPLQFEERESILRKFAFDNILITNYRKKYIKRKIIKQYSFDAIIVGSDQIWRPKYNPHIWQSFLSFALGTKIQKIAYGVSFGTNKWEYNSIQTKLCAFLVKKFKAVSVREAYGVNMCKTYFDINADLVLDPTLLCPIDEYLNLCSKIERRNPFVFAYILENDQRKMSGVIEFAEKHNLPYIIKGADMAVGNEDSVENWISFFRDAKYVITDSFHGTLFSILFKVDFYVYQNKIRGNERLNSILNILDLQERTTDYIISKSDKINWEKVDNRLNREITNSLNWITDKLRC